MPQNVVSSGVRSSTSNFLTKSFIKGTTVRNKETNFWRVPLELDRSWSQRQRFYVWFPTKTYNTQIKTCIKSRLNNWFKTHLVRWKYSLKYSLKFRSMDKILTHFVIDFFRIRIYLRQNVRIFLKNVRINLLGCQVFLTSALGILIEREIIV